ncbi:alpha/beta fold hydrolase [Colwellia sp. MEBiC06753]
MKDKVFDMVSDCWRSTMKIKGVNVSGTGPAIVFLHSSLSSSRQWLPLVKQLEQQFTCINIDILGYGLADEVSSPQDYGFDVETSRIKEALKQAIGEQSYHLVGHSCGGAIALKLAVECPQKVLSMTLFEPVAFHLLEKGTKEHTEAEEFARLCDIDDMAKAAEIFTEFWNSPGFYQSLPPKLQALMAKDMKKVILDFKGLISEHYTLGDLIAISSPSFIMTGKDSPYLSHFLADKLIQHLPLVSHQQVEGGHMAPISHAEDVQPKIADFILLHA